MFLSQQPASECEVSNYTLEIRDASSNILALSSLMPNETNSLRGNLLENQLYVFKVLISNAIGTVSTGNTTLCESQIVTNIATIIH